MKLPNAENAFVDLEKLRTYALDRAHRIGRHKARLFTALLGVGVEDAGELRDILLDVHEPLTPSWANTGNMASVIE